MGLRFLGHSTQWRIGGGWFLPVQAKQLPGMGWTRLPGPVRDTRAGVERGVGYVQVWYGEERRQGLPGFDSNQKGVFRGGGRGWFCWSERRRAWRVASGRTGSDAAPSSSDAKVNLWKRGKYCGVIGGTLTACTVTAGSPTSLHFRRSL